MIFFRQMKKDYLESRFSKYEGFLEWFLKRKLGFWGKMIFAGILWTFWLFIYSNPVYMIYLFYIVIILSLIVVVVEFFSNFKNKNKS
ncbi:TPA: hypothetical protein ACT2IF_002352 [Streptococcus suis]